MNSKMTLVIYSLMNKVIWNTLEGRLTELVVYRVIQGNGMTLAFLSDE